VRKEAQSVLARVARTTKKHGLYPIPKLIVVPQTGSGYHSGASMPMGGELIKFDGSLNSAPGVYVIDASVLPEIWAGSHTFTAMANAYRIAKDAR
jgi:choline dehydrogenase-like flavoprotein